MELQDESSLDDSGNTPSDGGPAEVNIVETPLSQSTYLAIWAISLVASFGIFFVYF